MMHKWCYEALDRTLRDLMGAVDPAAENLPFGGKVVVMGGDFRQILPVVKKGVRGDIVSASLRHLNHSGHIWQHVRVFSLHHNMRVARLQTSGDVAGARELQSFADYLQRLGEGTEQAYPVAGQDCVLIPPAMHCTGGEAATVDNLIEDVYPMQDPKPHARCVPHRVPELPQFFWLPASRAAPACGLPHHLAQEHDGRSGEWHSLNSEELAAEGD